MRTASGKAYLTKNQLFVCFRGVGSEENYIFRDENELKSFGALSEERKLKDKTSYKPVQCEKLTYLEKIWCVKTNFQGMYGEDYKMLTSSRTAYKDSYSISLFRKDECWQGAIPLERFDRQPLPDFKLWKNVAELHYMGYEEWRDFPSGS